MFLIDDQETEAETIPCSSLQAVWRAVTLSMAVESVELWVSLHSFYAPQACSLSGLGFIAQTFSETIQNQCNNMQIMSSLKPIKHVPIFPKADPRRGKPTNPRSIPLMLTVKYER